MPDDVSVFVKIAVTVDKRLRWLKAFAKLIGTRVQARNVVWSDGRYIIVHFDLAAGDKADALRKRDPDNADAHSKLQDVLNTFGAG